MMFRMYNPGSKNTAKDTMAHFYTPSEKISYANKFRYLLQDRTNESNPHTSTARSKREENTKYKVRHYNVQEGKDVKYKDYHYRIDPDLYKGKCALWHIPCAYRVCTNKLDSQWDTKLEPEDQPRYTPVEDC
eukprot:8249598-Ditylum_brightwellii.AAC.1